MDSLVQRAEARSQRRLEAQNAPAARLAEAEADEAEARATAGPWWWLSAISLAGRREGPTCASRRAPGQARPACWAEGGDRRRAPAAGRACSGDPHARAVRLQAKGPDQAR